MAYSLIGKDFVPPDVHAKVTGAAKYAEDFKVDGMLYSRLLTSPVPHARVRRLDVSAALEMDGVMAVLTADDVPQVTGAQNPILTNNPRYVGDPVLAVAAISEQLAEDAIAAIEVEFERLPFTVDPLHSLSPDGPNAHPQGNIGNSALQEDIRTLRWSREDFDQAGAHLPTGEPVREWTVGDLDTGFGQADLIIEESFVTASNSHLSMEPRSAMAYWQNGKCYLYGSSQSQSFPVPALAAYIGIPPEDLVFIAEFCGGGFGSKGSGYPSMSIPAHLSRLSGRPVMLRISREEEYYIGSARHGFQGRARIGFRADGRITAMDLYVVQDNGANIGFSDWLSAGDAVSLVYQPLAMRFRGVPVFTNTPMKGPQRGPGQNQIAAAIEPLLDKAARELGLDPLQIRSINAPDSNSRYGDAGSTLTSAHLPEALAKGAELFGWQEKIARNGRRDGNKVIGVGVGQAYHSAGSNGFDGLVRITPDGRLHIHTGVGNLGTYSHTGTSRVAAEVLKCRWENCEVERGDSRRHLPWNLGQFGSNTSFTMTRTNYVAALDAVEKLKEIAALDLGGNPADYDIGEERVFSRTDPTRQLTYAEAATRAIQLGGKYSGEVAPEDINEMTARSVAGLAGSGLIGVARDNLPKDGTVPALAAGFIQIELDLETGKFQVLDYVGVADCGTVIHPTGLRNQVFSAAYMGFGMAGFERHAYDPQNGLPANTGLWQSKPPTNMDATPVMDWAAIDKSDPQNPVGAKGVGEPIQGCAAAALICAISNALGGHLFNRVPVTADMIVNAVSGRPQSHGPLQTNTV
ncbi:MAG: xanthine dehydrogenase family protein molybdopterin-binding subunit [Gammaproteobacteria bacterium]|nr:xanthine dehydrogenase family protein molybdopterin-binding subunit [Pseudomonadales bacterium]MCP5348106.1 xanthine dehydrogenase family protein molybdopterin-binding subunit [Pseudomonadales bacterium]